MSYVQVQPGDLVIGQEYVLTRIGIESNAGNEGREFETVEVPQWVQRPGQPPPPTRALTRIRKPALVIAPPDAEKLLLNSYRAKVSWLLGDGRFGEGALPFYSTSGRRGAMNMKKNRKALQETVNLDTIRKRAFFAGLNAKGQLVFTQERTFSSRKPIAFVPVDVNEKNQTYYSKYLGLNPEGYAFWQMTVTNNTRRNKAPGEQNPKGGRSRRRTRKY